MFIVTVHLGKLELTTPFFTYEYALKEMNFVVEECENLRAIGFIKEYSVELKKE